MSSLYVLCVSQANPLKHRERDPSRYASALLNGLSAFTQHIQGLGTFSLPITHLSVIFNSWGKNAFVRTSSLALTLFMSLRRSFNRSNEIIKPPLINQRWDSFLLLCQLGFLPARWFSSSSTQRSQFLETPRRKYLLSKTTVCQCLLGDHNRIFHRKCIRKPQREKGSRMICSERQFESPNILKHHSFGTSSARALDRVR